MKHLQKIQFFYLISGFFMIFFMVLYGINSYRINFIERAATVLNGPPPLSGKQFLTLPPGSALPSGAECAQRVRRTTWEPKPGNTSYNNYVPVKGTDYNLQNWGGVDNRVNTQFLPRVDGNFKGTTDEILQWAACKWGIDEDIVRAQAVVESTWSQAVVGCSNQCFGILQDRGINGGTPAVQKSTAFNADYSRLHLRACYEGYLTWLGGSYHAGDMNGCLEQYFTGSWPGAGSYAAKINGEITKRVWESWTGTQISSMPTTPAGCAAKNRGDANCDGKIDLIDFEIFRKEFTGTLTTKTADFDTSGTVTIADFEIWRRGYFPNAPTGSPTGALTNSPTAAVTNAPSASNRINWQGKNWYLLGVNAPWYQWGCDFGCGTNGGITGNATVIDQRLKTLSDNNVHFVRWWVFPGDTWQINKDGAGMPTGLNQSIYQDFETLLSLGQKYNIYFNFVLFSGPTSLPSSWMSNQSQRTKLAQVLGELFRKYKDNPRIMTWEIINEPEWDIWNNKVAAEPVQDLVQQVASSVHTNSNALVTVGGAAVDGLPYWIGKGLDYYSPHWYDPMSSGDRCARCMTYAQLKSKWNVDKPVVIGELFAASSVDALNRYQDFNNNGYAGAWPWSLFSEKTNDQMTIDLNAMKTFMTQTPDAGPR